MNNELIRRCFDLGNLFKGYTKTNPLVGAVLYFEGEIINEGSHERYGKAHAEVNALKVNSVSKEILRKATIFVSLEPCFHYGKTPPCVDLIIENQIQRVVIACQDPNPLVAGKSIKKLQEAGIEVVSNIEQSLGERLIRPFVVGIEQKRPYIILKYAHSADGYMGFPNEPIWFTNTFSKHLSHKWRSEVDAILVGKNTALIDNPSLNNRLYFGKKKIVRILLDKRNAVPLSFNIFNEEMPTWVLNEEKSEENQHIRYFRSDFKGDYLKQFMQKLYENQIGSIIIEGGAKVLNSFIEANLWDEARVFATPKILNREDGIKAPIINEHLLKETHQIDTDVLKVYFNQ